MALVKRFEQRESKQQNLHDEVEATYNVLELSDGRRALQRNTYGRPNRKLKGKASQVLQLDEEGLAALKEIIRHHRL